MVETEGTHTAGITESDSRIKQTEAQQTPLGRIGQPQDHALLPPCFSPRPIQRGLPAKQFYIFGRPSLNPGTFARAVDLSVSKLFTVNANESRIMTTMQAGNAALAIGGSRGVDTTTARALSDRGVAELTETALEVALRQGVDFGLQSISKSPSGVRCRARPEGDKRPTAAGIDGLKPDRKLHLAKLTEAAYRTALLSGLKGSFIDLEIGALGTFRKIAYQAATNQSDCDDDFSDLLVRFEIAMRCDDLGERKRLGDHRLEFAGCQAVDHEFLGPCSRRAGSSEVISKSTYPRMVSTLLRRSIKGKGVGSVLKAPY